MVMANKKSIESIYREIETLTAKIKTYEKRLEELEKQKTEAENLKIIEKVRALYMTREELADFLKTGTIPEESADKETED